MFIWHSPTLLKFFLSALKVTWRTPWVSIGSYRLQKRIIWLLPFLFVSLLLLSLAKTWSITLSKNGESLVPFLTLQEMFQVFLFRMTFPRDLLHTIFTLLRNNPSVPNFFKASLIMGYWILPKAFSASSEISTWFYFWYYL